MHIKRHRRFQHTQHEQDLLEFSLFGRKVELLWVKTQFLGSDCTTRRNLSCNCFSHSVKSRHSGGERTYFSVSRATRMLSRVSFGGPWGTGISSVVSALSCSTAVLNDPGTSEGSSPCAERTGRELSALTLTSAPTATREELKTRKLCNTTTSSPQVKKFLHIHH